MVKSFEFQTPNFPLISSEFKQQSTISEQKVANKKKTQKSTNVLRSKLQNGGDGKWEGYNTFTHGKLKWKNGTLTMTKSSLNPGSYAMDTLGKDFAVRTEMGRRKRRKMIGKRRIDKKDRRKLWPPFLINMVICMG